MLTPEHVQFLSQLQPPPPHWGGTGATPLSLDPRDFDIRDLPGVSEVLAAGVPDSVDLTGFIRGPVLNQGQEGACVAFSTAHLGSIDDVIETGTWPIIDAEAMYRRAGGLGSNGVDSRLVLQQALDSGMPAIGGPVKVISSYAFVPQQPGVFSQTIKAALAAGYPVVLALLLPSDFGWQSGHGTRTSGYHQICLCGYTADGYFIFLNSWGSSFGHNGVGSVLIPYVESDNCQNNYAFAYSVQPSIAPTPTPTPTPVPARAAAVTGRAVAGPTNGIWPNVGATLPFGQDVTLTVSSIQFDGTPTPKPDPKPDPGPQPGGLTVAIPTKRYSASMVGIWAYASADNKPVLAHFTGSANQVILGAMTGSPAVWILRGAQAAGPLSVTINAATDDGRTGQGQATIP